MLNIPLENINQTGFEKLKVYGIERLATATSIVFIDPTHFVCANLVGARLYLFEFDYDNNYYKLLSKCDTTYDNKYSGIDIIDYSNGRIVVSNFQPGTQSIYKIGSDYVITKIKDLHCTKGGFCHGVKWYNENLICATDTVRMKVNFINVVTDKVVSSFQYSSPSYYPKDICFISSNRMAVLYTTSKMIHGVSKAVQHPISEVAIYDINLSTKQFILNTKLELPNVSHGDGITYYEGYIYCNNQIGSTIELIKLDETKLTYLGELPGFSMPHGVAIDQTNRLLGASNYGDNSIKIIGLDDDLFRSLKRSTI